MTFSEKPFDPANGCVLPPDEREGLLDAYATGELDPHEQQRLARHVAHCPQCQHTLVELRAYHRLLKGVFSAAPASEDGQDSLATGQLSSPTSLPLPVPRQQTPPVVSPPRRRPMARPLVRALLVAAILLILVANGAFVRFFLQTRQARQTTQMTATQKPHASPTASATPVDTLGGTWHTLLTLSPAPKLPPDDSYYPLGIPAITSSPADPTTLYLCRFHLTRGSLLPTVPHLLYRSDDLGLHWQELPLPVPAANCEIRPDPVQAKSIVLQDDRNGAFVSRDRGQHWQRIPPPPGAQGAEARRLQATPVAGRLYVSGYWTSDLHTWTRWYPLPLSYQDPGDSPPVHGPIDLRFLADPRHPDTIYTDMSPTCPGTRLPTGFPPAGQVLCRSDDDGRTWRLLAAIPIVPGMFDPSYCLVQDTPDVLYVRGIQPDGDSRGDFIRSTNGGASWQPIDLVRDPGIGLSLGCSASNDPYPYRPDSAAPFFTYDVSKSHFSMVDDPQIHEWNLALTENGTLYYASATAEQHGLGVLPAGIAVLAGTRWTRIAPLPPAYAVGLSRHPFPDVYRMAVQVLTSQAGPPVILAYDDERLYRYMGT
ncbi:MAG: zf-HC2 domain-containing protein [Chloroflexota bacterium]|nr:zf-HC2 domain-containing protein [Chloroflexota bacterium]